MKTEAILKQVTVAILFLVCTGIEAWALSPPQYGLQRALAATFGQSPCVHVSNVYKKKGVYMIDVQGCTEETAKGLAAVVKLDWEFGGLHTIVRPLDPDGKVVKAPKPGEGEDPAAFMQEQFTNALDQNPLFVTIHPSSTPFGPDFWIEFSDDIVQYWNDDIGDYYGNTNMVAAQAFANVCRATYLHKQVTPGWTTRPSAK